MKSFLTTIVISLVLVQAVQAQKGRNQVNIAAEATLPFFQNDRGWGVYVKGFYGIGNSAQLTLMTGYSHFENKNSLTRNELTTRLIPVLLGYKQNIKKFFIEPQAGFGELGGRVDIGGDYARPSVGAFYWALGAGFEHKRLTTGLRFQQAHGTYSPNAGLWHDRNFHHTSLQVGYRLF